jgi:hypothetical protein
VESGKVINFNFSLLPEVAAEFRQIGNVHGERNKLRWAVASAAVLRLLEMPEEELHELIREVAGARHYPDKIKKMVEEAKARANPKFAGRGFKTAARPR